MTDHVFDELPGLLTGELDRATTGRVAAHLNDCDDCRRDLVAVVAASAAMRSAVRFAPEAIGVPERGLPDPSALLAEIAAAGPAEEAADDEEDEVPAAASAPQRRARRWWTAAAAAVLVLAGLGAGLLIGRDRPGGGPNRQIALEPVRPWNASATVTMQGPTMSIDPTDLPAPRAGHFYEVWLVNRSQPTPKLLPVGVLASDGPSEFALTDPLLAGYTSVEISDEPDDGDPAFSGNSVMQGRYR